ncbi:MAG TPA: FAD-binding oxidoreductase, partial [Streptosporangiaceae bacterium]
MAISDQYRTLSFWHDTVPEALKPGDPLSGDLDADVAIVGAGFTGLWTAYYLARRDPTMRVVVCEREIAGYGASGRNGGWCSALFPASLAKLARMSDRDRAIAMQRAMHATVDEVGSVTAAEGIDCHWAKGGTV